MKEAIARSAKRSWRAIILCAAVSETGRTIRNGKILVVHYHQIKPAIPVIVQKGRTGAPAWIVRPGFFRDIFKRAVAFVEKHLVGTQVRNIDIRPAIVVNVADGHSHSVPGGDDTALLGYIGEAECAAAVPADCQVVAKESGAR